MPGRVYLHVGTPKSGTTYIQDVFATNKELLASKAGLLFPGADWQDQVLAVRELRQMRRGGEQPANTLLEGAWQRLVDEVMQWQNNAVVSMEWLGSANAAEVRRAVDSFAPAEVRVIVTARRLARIVPAAWQESCQNQRTCTWGDFLKSIAGDQPATRAEGRQFWRQQDLARVLDNWLSEVPPERLFLVTVPEASAEPSLLWTRFCEAIDLEEPHRYEVTATPANASLGLESSELMRRVNEVVTASRIPAHVYERVFKRGLAKQALVKRRADERSPNIPIHYHSWLSERSHAMIAEIVARGVKVVGDLADLETASAPPVDGAEDEGADVTAEDLLEVALTGFIDLVQRQDDENRRLRGELRALQPQ
ncbi:MAG: hypothetical protein ACR2KG_12795 [Nocardioidaceae bacterium]